MINQFRLYPNLIMLCSKCYDNLLYLLFGELHFLFSKPKHLNFVTFCMVNLEKQTCNRINLINPANMKDEFSLLHFKALSDNGDELFMSLSVFQTNYFTCLTFYFDAWVLPIGQLNINLLPKHLSALITEWITSKNSADLTNYGVLDFKKIESHLNEIHSLMKKFLIKIIGKSKWNVNALNS